MKFHQGQGVRKQCGVDLWVYLPWIFKDAPGRKKHIPLDFFLYMFEQYLRALGAAGCMFYNPNFWNQIADSLGSELQMLRNLLYISISVKHGTSTRFAFLLKLCNKSSTSNVKRGFFQSSKAMNTWLQKRPKAHQADFCSHDNHAVKTFGSFQHSFKKFFQLLACGMKSHWV